MRALDKYSRTLILCFLCLCVLMPIFLMSHRLKQIKSDVTQGFVGDLSIIKHRTEAQTLSALEQEETEGLKEPLLVVYKDDMPTSAVNSSSIEDTRYAEVRYATNDANFSKTNGTSNDRDGGQNRQPQGEFSMSRGKEESHTGRVQNNRVVRTRSRVFDEKLKEMKDQVIRARAYLTFTPANISSHLVKELKLRIKDVERATHQSIKDSRISKGSLQKMKAMDSTLSKASHLYPDCAAMIRKLRAMTHNAEEQVRLQRNQETFLRALGGRTIPKGLHCLSMRLTAEYFALESEERELPYKNKLQDLHLYHFAVFSDNVLACAVVVNSTVSTAKREGSVDPRYTSELNYLRFYLPDLYPRLDKIVFLDHDVVVKKDLTRLWSIDMRDKVNGAVQTCKEEELSFRRMDMFVNFADPVVANKFDANTCTWAFGMNLFDLDGWRQRDLTSLYHKYVHLGKERAVWKAGSLPIGWATFYEETIALDKSWQVMGLGYDPGLRQEDIDEGAVLHYDGILKPWLDLGIEMYKPLWRKHVKYEHPYLQQCNVS